MKYPLESALWYWPRETLEDFYQQVAISQTDIICLDEATYNKRRTTKVGDWFGMTRSLVSSGKRVVLSTLVLVQASFELGELKRYIKNGDFPLEVGGLGVVNMYAERKLPSVAGYVSNCHNTATLCILLG